MLTVHGVVDSRFADSAEPGFFPTCTARRRRTCPKGKETGGFLPCVVNPKKMINIKYLRTEIFDLASGAFLLPTDMRVQ